MARKTGLMARVADHPRLLAAGAGSAAATLGAMLWRRQQRDHPALPAPKAVGALAAVSIHNASKGAVISAVREAEQPEGYMVGTAVATAIAEAARAGVDLAPAAIGAVEGAVEVAHVVGESPLAAGQRAAAAAVQEAESVSELAAERLRDILGPYLSHGTDQQRA
jgi:hypothetical protein